MKPTTGKLKPEMKQVSPPSDDSGSELSAFEADFRKGIERDAKEAAESKEGKRKRRKVEKTADEEHREAYRKKQKSKKRRVEQMSSKEAKRERKQNPLISLLNITIELTDTSGSDSDVEADRKTARRGKLKFASSPEKPLPDKLAKKEQSGRMLIDDGTETEDDGDWKPDVKPKISVEVEVIDSEDEDDRTRALKRAGLYNPNGAAPAPAVASSSKVKLEDSCRPLATTVKLENSAPPVASSSKVKLEDTPMVIHSDEEEYMDDITRARLRTRRESMPTPSKPVDSDEEEMMDDLTAARKSAGLKVETLAPPPINLALHLPEDPRPFFRRQDHSNMVQEPLFLGKDEETGRRIEVPATINRYLREYQREGIRFFYKHYALNEGGILGDDMGLGKTIQVIAFLAAIMHRSGGAELDQDRRPTAIRAGQQVKKATDLGPTCLLIVPTSVVYNWMRELDTWGYFESIVFKGSEQERRSTIKRFGKGFYDVVICGLDAARTHVQELNTQDFSCVIIDECHRVKNPRAQTTIAMQTFVSQRRFGLTGTAMQNRYGEMWTILDWAFPRRLGSSSDWKAWVETPISRAQRHNSSMQELAIGRERAIALVQNLLPSFFLRRTKDLIADQLPKKIDKIVFCPLSDQQIDAYRRLLAHEEVQLIITHDEPCTCGALDNNGLPFQKGNCCHREWSKLIFRYMTLFQKLANHACLIYPDRADLRVDPDKFEQDTKWIELAFPTDHRHRVASFTAEQDKSLCGKWKVLQDLLRVWKKQEDKVLIFSRSKRLLNAIEHWMTEEYPDAFRRLDGMTPTDKRLPLCDEFNNDDSVFAFLISTLAGGVGLNLTAANKVVIFGSSRDLAYVYHANDCVQIPTGTAPASMSSPLLTLHRNPSHDAQAQDRAYRWGQLRDIEVFRLIGAGSLEELIYTRQIYKQQQNQIAYKATAERRYFSGVQDDSQEKGELFGVKNIFRLRDESLLVKPIIDQCNVAELGYALSHLADDGDKKGKKADEEEIGEGIEGDGGVESAITRLVQDPEASRKALEQPAKASEIDEILLRNNISYTHHNDRVIGESAIEQAVSRNAMKMHAENRRRKNARHGETGANAYGGIKRNPIKLENAEGAVWPPPRKKGVLQDASATPDFKPRELQPRREELQGLVAQAGGGNDLSIELLVEAAGFANPNALMEHLGSHKVEKQTELLDSWIARAKAAKRAAAAERRAAGK